MEGKLELLKSAAGFPKLCCNGFMYVFHKEAEKFAAWKCCNFYSKDKRCRGRIQVSVVNGLPTIKPVTPHNHDPEPEKISKHKWMAALREKAMSSSMTPHEIIDEVAKDFEPSVYQSITLESAKKYIRMTRNNALSRNYDGEDSSAAPSEKIRGIIEAQILQLCQEPQHAVFITNDKPKTKETKTPRYQPKRGKSKQSSEIDSGLNGTPEPAETPYVPKPSRISGAPESSRISGAPKPEASDYVFKVESRWIDLTRFVMKLRELDKHSKRKGCGFSSLRLVGERQEGLNTGLEFRCISCLKDVVVWLLDKDTNLCLTPNQGSYSKGNEEMMTVTPDIDFFNRQLQGTLIEIKQEPEDDYELQPSAILQMSVDEEQERDSSLLKVAGQEITSHVSNLTNAESSKLKTVDGIYEHSHGTLDPFVLNSEEPNTMKGRGELVISQISSVVSAKAGIESEPMIVGISSLNNDNEQNRAFTAAQTVYVPTKDNKLLTVAVPSNPKEKQRTTGDQPLRKKHKSDSGHRKLNKTRTSTMDEKFDSSCIDDKRWSSETPEIVSMSSESNVAMSIASPDQTSTTQECLPSTSSFTLSCPKSFEEQSTSDTLVDSSVENG